MDAAHFVAALMGPIYIVVGIGILVDPEHYRRMADEFLRSPALLYIGGAIALSVGLAILYFQNAWTGGWPVVITAIGWLATLKGAYLLIAPGHAHPLWSPVISAAPRLRVASLAVVAFGVFLALVGYELI